MTFGLIGSRIRAFDCCDSAVCCALHDQLASLGRHAPLTRCFPAVAELLVLLQRERETVLCCEHWTLWYIWQELIRIGVADISHTSSVVFNAAYCVSFVDIEISATVWWRWWSHRGRDCRNNGWPSSPQESSSQLCRNGWSSVSYSDLPLLQWPLFGCC